MEIYFFKKHFPFISHGKEIIIPFQTVLLTRAISVQNNSQTNIKTTLSHKAAIK